ncbi:type II toxin-antitoxin system mRNA interferase toxin, RelE/StbE family [Candidatus Peregrinibacteria bacterium CG11_big_fil_rev_8_21_14_0_20_46_8]|nr:MAG: type II toxin-antitoxin system mRNA interferase toxin, RelE/StbE family [Candidatus Peregrinibacteria bacterium CG11_big_fil_rev_8_21_14_0_20_46_8]
MQVFRHKNFAKQYRKLNSKKQALVDTAISLFYENPFDERLRNHPLKGKYKGCNSIDAAFDLRIIFKQEKNYFIVILLKIGNHSQLY